jgi:thiamine pyrophosphokinase
MEKSALLIAHGEDPGENVLRSLMSRVSYILCTDGACNYLHAHRIRPDAVIGDLDSLAPDSLTWCSSQVIIVRRPSQESTDLQKALLFLQEEGFVEVIVCGVKGGRMDHLVSNLSILLEHSSKIHIVLADPEGYGRIVVAHQESRGVSLSATRGTTVSLLSLSQAHGVTTQGLKYPLADDTLAFGARIGQSNEVIISPSTVTLQQGVVLVYVWDPTWYRSYDAGRILPLID